MNSRWRTLAVILVLTATILTVAHSHQGWESQRCSVCRVQERPLVHTVQILFLAPIVFEWRFLTVERPVELKQFSSSAFGRAPPRFFFI